MKKYYMLDCIRIEWTNLNSREKKSMLKDIKGKEVLKEERREDLDD
jgi:hypothetical protein